MTTSNDKVLDKNTKSHIKKVLEGVGFGVRFSRDDGYSFFLEVLNKPESLATCYSDIYQTVNRCFENLKNCGCIDFEDIRTTSGSSDQVRFKITVKERPNKHLLDRVSTEKFKPCPNKFGQIPEIGDYIIGNKSGNITHMFIAEIVGWDSKALIVKNIMGWGEPGEYATMRWAENLIIPKDMFGGDFESFLVMMKLQS